MKKITETTCADLDELTKIVSAVALHASTDKQRYCLTGIYITCESIQATDSYTLGIYTPIEPLTMNQPALINAKELTTALNNLNKAAGKATTTATLTITGDKWQLTATSGETTIGSYAGQTITAEYPNTKQLLDMTTPATTPFEATGLNPEYLGRLTKASHKISKTTPLTMAIWQTPSRPIIYTTTTTAGTLTQLIMPQKINQ